MEIKEELLTNELVKAALKEYGIYVIEDRALPDARDGLKPAQRRLLWTLYTLRRGSGAVPAKCARVIGEMIGKYHPHGDMSAYDTLVNMAWLRYPLAEKHGNFGSRSSLIDTGYAAQRYTETRMSPFADRMLDDVEIAPKDKSYTEEDEEPKVILARVPLLLANGTNGVAVGMATNIPPHNLEEVINAVIHCLENPDCTTKDLMDFVKGPDYGSGAITTKKSDLLQMYENGEGRVGYTCTYNFEEVKKGVQRLVITGLAPGFKKTKFVEATKKLAEQKLIKTPAIDEGSLERGTRITVEFTDPKIVQDRVIPLLRSSISYQFYALGGKKTPKKYTLKGLIEVFIKFRRVVEKAVLNLELANTKKKKLTEEAKLAAIDNIDKVKEILTTAESAEDAVKRLIKDLSIVEEQAQTILNTQLRSLIKKSNRTVVRDRISGYIEQIQEIKDKLENIDGVVADRLKEMLKFSDKRGTKLRFGGRELEAEAATYYVGVTPKAKVEVFNSPPSNKKSAWSYTNMVKTEGSVAVVSAENVGQFVSISYLDRFDDKVGDIVGVTSEDDEVTVAVSETGKYVAFKTKQKRNKFPVFRSKEPETLVAAVGMKESDKLIVILDDDTIVELDDLKVTRPNVAPKPVKRKNTKKVVRVYPFREDRWFLNDQGTEIGVDELVVYDNVFQVGDNNMIVMKDGRRQVKSFNDTVKLLSDSGKDVVAITPV